jgi:hypothetical protein
MSKLRKFVQYKKYMNKKLILTASLLCPFYGYADVVLQIDSNALTSWNYKSTGTNDVRIYNSEQTITILSDRSGLVYDIGPSSPGTYFAHITPNLGSDNIEALATALGVSSSGVASIQPGSDYYFSPTNFGYFGKSLTLNAGTTYKFYWSMANGDYSPFTDGSFMALSQGGNLTNFSLLGRVSRYSDNNPAADGATTSQPGDLGFQSETKILSSYGASPWVAKTFTVDSTGTYRLIFGAFNTGDRLYSPHLFVSDLEGTIETAQFGLFSINYFYPSAAETQASLQYAALQLRGAFNAQTAASNLSLNHDCNLFDTKGLCISAGGRYTAIDNPTTNASAAVVTLGYKVNPNIRFGGFLDQNVNIHSPSSINIANKNPLMGLYALWNKEASGLGFQLRLANTYQDKDVTTTRLAVGDTGEAGSGSASLNSQSYLAELSYAFQYQDKTLVRPYFGLRHTRLKQDGYTESSGAQLAPLKFNALADRSTTALMGARVNYQATLKTALTASLGIEQDLNHKVDNYVATNSDIADLTPIIFNSNIKRLRPVASAGAYYDVTKAQRLSGTVTYQQLPFQSTGATSLYVNYMIGF